MLPQEFTGNKSGDLVQNFSGQWCFIPHALPPTLTWTDDLVSLLSAADRAIGALVGMGHRLPNPALLTRSFLRREAELSSRIEGTRANLKQVVLFEEAESIERKVPDVREVLNNFRVLEWGLQQVKLRPISQGLIREMHKMLLKQTRGQDKLPGQYRNVQAIIGRITDTPEEARFVPPPPHLIQPAMDQLEQYIQSLSVLPPLVRVALVHYQFETIHPFADGNGRIGRVLILLMLCAEKTLPVPLLNPSEFMERHRSEYYQRLLEVSQRGAWNEWIAFFLRGITQEAADSRDRIKALDDLRTQYQETVRTARASALIPSLVDHLFTQPAITVARAAQLLNITPRSAQKCIDKLVDEKIVHEFTGRKRNRIYLANKIISVLQSRRNSNKREPS